MNSRSCYKHNPHKYEKIFPCQTAEQLTSAINCFGLKSSVKPFIHDYLTNIKLPYDYIVATIHDNQNFGYDYVISVFLLDESKSYILDIQLQELHDFLVSSYPL